MMNQVPFIKAAVIVLQVFLTILLVLTGLHLQDISKYKDLIQSARATGDGKPFTSDLESLRFKVNIRYGILLIVIILSSLKVPMISVGIFLNHVLILFGSFIIDVIVGPLYIVYCELQVYTEYTRTPSMTSISITDYSIQSFVGLFFSAACQIVTVFLIITIQKQARNAIIRNNFIS